MCLKSFDFIFVYVLNKGGVDGVFVGGGGGGV